MKTIACSVLASIMVLPVFANASGESQTRFEVVPAYGFSSESGATYPQMALRHGVSGEVLVEYDINANGRAENIEVIETSPKAYFVSSTLRALENSSFGADLHKDAATEERVQKRFIYVMDRPDRW